MFKLFLVGLTTFFIANDVLPAVRDEILEVPELAQQDEIWTKSWEVLQKDWQLLLSQGSSLSTVQQIALESELGIEVVNSLLKYFSNYGRTNTGPDRVLYRYPHYNRSAIEEDYDLLVAQNLAVGPSDSGHYEPTIQGQSLLSRYNALTIAQLENLPADTQPFFTTVAQTLHKVTNRALEMESSFENSSIRWRRESWFPEEMANNPALQAREFYRDYTAFNNDNAHYRFKRATQTRVLDKQLDALSKELFASVRNQRSRPLSYCTDHMVWRQNSDACELAFKNLIALNLIIVEAGMFSQTVEGGEKFNLAQKAANSRFYAPWSVLTHSEYSRYKDALEFLHSRLSR